MKRTLTSIVAATMVLGTAVPAAFAAAKAPANDISNSPYATAISLMQDQGVYPLYSDGAFRPTLDVSRGQFIAYLYNILAQQKVITKHYTEKTQPYTDVTADFRNQINDMYLYGFLNNVDLGNGALGQNYKSPKWWIAQVLCNIASISYDSSNPWDALNKARAAGFFDNTNDKDKLGDKDADGSLYYMSREEMAQVFENFYNVQYPSALKGVPTSLSLDAASDSIQTGQADQLSVSGKDNSGAAATLDATQVVYSADPSSTGFVNGSGVFTATAAGTYTVTANYGSFSASKKITVYGTPSALAVSTDKDLVADGASSATVTVKVNDSNGNLVSNYNGPVTLTSSNGNDASVGSGTTATTSQVVNAKNGVATFTVYALGGAVAGDAPTLTATVAGNTTATGTGTVKVDAPVATGFSVDYAPNAPHGLAVNSAAAQTAVVITALDQAGNKLTSVNEWAQVSVSGPASLLGSTTTTENVWIGAGQSNPVYIQGKQAVSGNVVVTVSASGMNNATFTVPAYVQSAATSLVASASATSIGTGSTTTVTIKELDANGNLAVIGSDGSANTHYIAFSDDSNGGAIQYLDASGTAITNNQVQLVNGIATLQVKNNGFTGSANVKVSDGLLTTTLPIAFTAGTATYVEPVTSSVYAPDGSTQSVTFQVNDAAHHAIKVAGQTFAVSATSDGAAYTNITPTSATSDANGQFTVKVTLPNADNKTVTVSAVGTGNSASITGPTSESLTTVPALNMVTSVSGNVYDLTAAKQYPVSNLAALNAGQAVYLDVYGLDAVGLTVGASDKYTVTSSNSSIVSASYLGANDTSVAGSDNSKDVRTQPYVTLKAGNAGTATITITDTSVVGSPSYSFNVTVKQGFFPGSLKISGLTSSQSVVAGQTYALSVQLADAGGNPVFLQQGDSQVNLGLSDYTTDGSGNKTYLNDFRSAANGYTTSTASIPQYGNNATVYWTAPASGTKNITLSFSGSYVPAKNADGSDNTVNKTPVAVSGTITGINVQ